MKTNLRSVAAALLLAALAPAARAGITDNLVGYWNFDDGSGTTLTDFSQYGNNGALLNFPGDDSQWVPGQIGGALNFNAAFSQYVVVSNYTKPTTTMTVSAWAWADSNPGWATIAKCWAAGSMEFHFGLFDTGGQLDNWINESGSAAQVNARDATVLPLGRWQHVAFVCDGSYVWLYRNGVQVGRVHYNGTINADPAVPYFGIGGNPKSPATAWSFWQGKIDDLGLWDRALAPEEIAGIYLAGLNGLGIPDAVAAPPLPAEVLNDLGEYGFPRFLSAANASSKGWLLGPAAVIPASVVLHGATLVANSGADDVANGLIWNTAPATYSLAGMFTWGNTYQQAARDGLSQGGVYQGGGQSFSMKLAASAGKTYVVEVLSLNPWGWGNRSMSVSVDNHMVVTNWTVFEQPGLYNRVLRLKVVADADGIDLTFWPGSVYDVTPAISAVALTEWAPGVVTDETAFGFPALATAGNGSSRAWNFGDWADDAQTVVLNGVTFSGNLGTDDPAAGLTFLSPPGLYGIGGYGWGGMDQETSREALTRGGLYSGAGDIAMNISATPGQTYLLEFLAVPGGANRCMDLIVDGVTVVDEMRLYDGPPWSRVVRYQFTADGDGIDLHVGHGSSAGMDNTPIIEALVVTEMSPMPAWVLQPQGATRWEGESFSFSGLASASLPITYAWYREGESAPIATGYTLALRNLSAADAGNYFLVATTGAGSVTSGLAALTVNPVTVITDGLIGYWNFEEGSGSLLTDSSIYGNNGALQNYPDDSQWVDGRVGKALAFDGVSQYVLVPDYPKATNVMTLSAWVWADSRPEWATIAKNWTDAPHSHFHYGLTGLDGDISNYIKQQGADYGLREGVPLPLGAWQHVAVAFQARVVASACASIT